MTANHNNEIESRDEIVSSLKMQLLQLKESTDFETSRLQKKLSGKENELENLNIRLSQDGNIARNYAKENSNLVLQAEKLSAECKIYQNQIKDLMINEEETQKKLTQLKDEQISLNKENTKLTCELQQLNTKLECEQNNNRTDKASRIEVLYTIL